jgi:hypothetical protein
VNELQKNLIYPKVLNNTTTNTNSNDRRVYYVRYDNTIMFGIDGSKSLASLVKKECSVFMINNLNFKLRATDIYNAKTCGVEYIGFVVKSPGCTVLNNKKMSSST